MKTKSLLLVLLGMVLFDLGCAHYHRVLGRQEKTEIPEGIKANIGSPHVKEGDFVDIFKKKCTKVYASKGNSTESCVTTMVAQAPVLKVLSEDISIISPPTGFQIESDMYVEVSDSNGKKQMKPLICPQ
ncbi:MAG: hypothetical protein B7Y39_12520 [Bdellovibrio sp. 28-41-41]|nr:MAG: hypothetical protein B7Y39_12520 [Bdellovibrio sp. 28-41-41]